jgi:propionyl-CoA synthetase
MGSYRDFYQRSIDRPEEFWGEQANLIHWHKPYDRVLKYDDPPFAWWFVGGETNLCYNAVDRHLPERADQKALVYVSTETGDERTFTFRELTPRSTGSPPCCGRSAWARATASSSTCR